STGTLPKAGSGLQPFSRKLPVALLTTAALMVTVSSAHATASAGHPPVPRAVPKALAPHHAKHARRAPRGLPRRPVHATRDVILGGPNYLISTSLGCSSWYAAGGTWWYHCTTTYDFYGEWQQTDMDYYYYVGDPHVGRYAN